MAYRALGEDMYEIDTPVGPTVVRSDEATLQAAGHAPSEGEIVRDFPAEPMAPPEPAFGGEFGQIYRADPYERLETTPGIEKPSLFDPNAGTLAGGFSSAQAKADRELAEKGLAQPTQVPDAPAVRQGMPTKQAEAVSDFLQPKADFTPRAEPPKPGKGSSVRIDAAPPAGQAAGSGGTWSPDETAALGQVYSEAMRGGGQGRMISPGGIAVSGIKTSQKNVDPSVYEGLDDPAQFDPLRAATAKRVQASRDQQARMQEMELDQGAELVRKRQERADINKKIYALHNEAQHRWQTAANAKEIDPEQYDKNLGFFGRILAGLSIFLSRVGSGITKMPPYAEQAIQQARKDNIDAQKANWERTREAADMADNAFGRAVKMWGTPELAEKHMDIELQELENSKLRRMALATGDAEIIENTEKWIAEKEAELGVKKAALLNDGAAEIETSYARTKPTYAGGGGADRTAKALKATAEAAKNLRTISGKDELSPELREKQQVREDETLIQGLEFGPGKAPDAVTARELRTGEEAYAQSKDSLRRMREIAADAKAGRISKIQAWNQLQSEGVVLGAKFKTKEQMGTLDAGLQAMLKDLTGLGIGSGKRIPTSPGELYGVLTLDQKLQQIEKGLDTDRKRTLQIKVRKPDGSPYLEKEPAK